MSLEDRLRKIFESEGLGGETGNSHSQTTQTTRNDYPPHKFGSFDLGRTAERIEQARIAESYGESVKYEHAFSDGKNLDTAFLVRKTPIGQVAVQETMQSPRNGMSFSASHSRPLFRSEIIGVVKEVRADGVLKKIVSTKPKDIQQAKIDRDMNDTYHYVGY